MQNTLSRTRLHTGAAYDFVRAPGYAGQNGPWPAVLIVHGWGSQIFSNASYTMAAARLGTLGYHCLLLSLRGHEGSDGDINQVSRDDHAADIEAAIDYLAERPEVDTSRLGAVGVSYGGYMLACSTPIRGLQELVLRAPALYPDDGWREPTARATADPGLASWRSIIHPRTESYALNGLERYKGKALIVWSEMDEYLPPQVLESYLAVLGSAGASTTIMGAKHTLTEVERLQYLSALEQFFRENYPARNATPTV